MSPIRLLEKYFSTAIVRLVDHETSVEQISPLSSLSFPVERRVRGLGEDGGGDWRLKKFLEIMG